MKIGYSHSDVYDRESDYWRDMEDALPKEKSPNSSANENEQSICESTSSIARNSKNITGDGK